MRSEGDGAAAAKYVTMRSQLLREEQGDVVVIEGARDGFQVTHVFPRASSEKSRSRMEAFRRAVARLLAEEEEGV